MRTYAQKPNATQQTNSAESTKPDRTHFGQSHEVNSILRPLERWPLLLRSLVAPPVPLRSPLEHVHLLRLL